MKNKSRRNGSKSVPFSLRKVDSVTGADLAGAIFELQSCNGAISRGATNSWGTLGFSLSTCSTYTIREVSPPLGYLPEGTPYNICVDSGGFIYVNGTRVSRIVIKNTAIFASFSAVKVNIENDAPLAGAEYALLRNSDFVASAVSTNTGAVTFTNLSPGSYELIETKPPVGFQENGYGLPVVVNADRSVTIQGEPANGYRLNNIPIRSFIFIKLDAATDMPLAGAVFQLAQAGVAVQTATSGLNGAVDFGIILPGIYELTETVAPPGYLSNGGIYQAVVEANGSITVGGVDLDDFRVRDAAFPGFSFIKTGNATGLPLQGAVFELRRNGVQIGTSTSDLLGFVSFSSLSPGLYQLEEILAPAGYVVAPAVYEVTVSSTGDVTVDGLPYRQFSVVDLAAQNTDSYSLSADVVKVPLSGRLNMLGFSLEEGVNGNVNMPSGVGVPATQPSFFGNVFDGEYIWLNAASSDKLVRVSALTGSMRGFGFAEGENGNTNMGDVPTRSGRFAGGVLIGNQIWLVSYSVNRLVSLNIATGSMLGFSFVEGVNGNVNMGTLDVTASKFHGGVYAGGFIWLVPANAAKVVRVDPATGSMRGFDLTEGTNGNVNMPAGINLFNGGLFDGRYVWMIPFNSTKVVRLDPATGSMRGYDMTEGENGNVNMGNLGNAPLLAASKFYGGVFDGLRIWMIPGNANRVIRLNPATGSMTGFELSEGVNGNANMGNADTVTFKFTLGNYDGRNIWAFPFSANRLIKINPQTGSMTGYELGEGTFPNTTNTNMGDVPTAAGKLYGGGFDGKNLWASPYRSNRLVRISSNE